MRKRAFFHAVLWLTATVYSLIRGSFVGDILGDALIPELSVILTVYLVVCSGPRTAGIFALFQGFLMDLLSGGIRGLFLGFHLIAFSVAVLGRNLFDIHHPKGQLIITMLSVASAKLLFLVVVILMSPNAFFAWPWAFRAASAAVVSGIVSPVIIALLQSIRRLYTPDWTEGFEAQLDEVGVLPRLWRHRKQENGLKFEEAIKSEKF